VPFPSLEGILDEQLAQQKLLQILSSSKLFYITEKKACLQDLNTKKYIHVVGNYKTANSITT
jgi:hypothetical protein